MSDQTVPAGPDAFPQFQDGANYHDPAARFSRRQSIPLDRLWGRLVATQGPESFSEETVARYEAEGVTTPVLLRRSPGSSLLGTPALYYVLDGHHRLVAARRRGDDKILVQVI